MKRLLLSPFYALLALAALALGAKPRKNEVPGSLKMAVLPVTYPVAYVQNEDLKPAAFGFTQVKHGFAVIIGIGTGTVNVANVVYDYENDKLRLYDETPAQIAGGAEVKGVKVLVYAFGV